MKMFVYPYNRKSKAARALARALECKVLTRPKRSRKEIVVNWGSPRHDQTKSYAVNHHIAVGYASHKLSTFQILRQSDIAVPDFTNDINIAKSWIQDGEIVVCRTLLRSHSGKGIVVANSIDELVPAPLYTKYFKKSYEFRVHVFNGKVIDSVQKRKRSGLSDTGYNKYIRSHRNGWVFCRENNKITEKAKKLAIESVKALGLMFGAVDIVMKASGKCKVLEINTAPALEGKTLKSYVKAIKEFVNV